MFQTGALSRTGGSFCPSATGHFSVFYTTPSFLEQWRKKPKRKKNRWQCRSVCAVQCQFPRRVSPVHLIPWSPNRSMGSWSSVSEQALDLWSQLPHRCPAAPTQTMDMTYHKLCAGATENHKKKTLHSLPTSCPALWEYTTKWKIFSEWISVIDSIKYFYFSWFDQISSKGLCFMKGTQTTVRSTALHLERTR